MNNSSSFGNLNVKLLGSSGRGEQERVEELLELGADINYQNQAGKTPLMKAFAKGHLELGLLLIQRGADVSLKDEVGNSALAILVSLDLDPENLNGKQDIRIKIFEEVISKGLFIDHKDAFGVNLFKKAYQKDNISLAMYLLGKNLGKNPLELNECIHKVLDNNELKEYSFQIEAIHSLLKEGGDINGKDPLGRTPLMKALQGFQFELSEHLIREGADLKSKDSLDSTTFDYMCIFPANLNESGVSTFLTKFYHVTLEEMLDQYAKTVKSFNLDKAIPLAMQKDNHFMVQLLLKKGALCDTEILDYLINQSYRVPSVFLKSHYLETLLERGANINALDAKQRNTLINFIIKGKLKEAQLLVERDANPLQKDIKGKDAFSYLSQLKRVYGYEDNGGNISALFDVMLSKVKPTEKSEVLKKVVTESVKSKNWFLIIECMNKGFDYNNTLIMGKKLVQLANISGEEEIAKKINTLNSNQNKKLLEIIYQKGDPSGLESLQKMTPIPQQDIDLQMKTLIELLMNKEKSYLKLEAQFRENNDDTSMDSHFWYQLEEMDLEFQENKNRIESLIFATQKMGGNLDLKDPKGRTYLMKAIQEGAYETAKVLISLGVDIHAKDSLGFDALSYLVTSPFSANGNIDVSNQHVFTWEKVYEALVERDVNLKGVDNFGFGGVEKAILNQNYNIALRLLEDGAPFSKNVLEEKLGEFSKSDAFDPLVRMIIDRGLSTEKVGHDGRDPLMNSLLHGAIENACLIGNHKENLSHVDKAGNTVYHYMTDAVKRAQELYQEDMPFEFNKFRMNKFKENFEKMMEIAFSKNKNLDQRNDLGITPLLHALNHGVLALARRLMNNNARMDICDNMGNNPFHFMCKLSEPLTEKKQERFLGLMKSFYENGVNPFKENIYGDTPLSLAEASGNSLAIKTILGYYYELPVDGKNKDGATQLMKACFDGNILDIRRLMSKDIEKTMKDHEGKTPLFYAVMGNQPQAIAELAKTLSDVQILDQKGNSAIDTAIHYNKPEALFTLLNIYEKEIPYLPVKAESLEQLNPLLREHMHRMSKNDEDVCIEFITYQLRKMSPNHRSLRGFSISNAMGEFHHQPKLTGTRNHANTTLTRKIGMGSKRRGAIVILKPRIMHNGKGSFVKTFSI